MRSRWSAGSADGTIMSDSPSQLVVLDASVAIGLLKGEASATSIRDVLRGCQADRIPLAVPGLFWLEVINILSRDGRTGSDILAAVYALEELRLQTMDPDRAIRLLVIDLCERHRLTAYDALYLALAEVTDGRLLTLDRRLALAAGDRAVDLSARDGRALHDPRAAYASEPTWHRWSGAPTYLAELRSEALEPVY